MDFIHQDKDVIWIKDGSFFFNNGVPPTGLTLKLDSNLMNKISQIRSVVQADLQGSYQCMVWGMNPYKRVTSKKGTVTFDGAFLRMTSENWQDISP